MIKFLDMNRYEMMKDNLRDKNGESYEIIRFNSVKSKICTNKKHTLCNLKKKFLAYKREILLSILCVFFFFFFRFLGIYIKKNTIE